MNYSYLLEAQGIPAEFQEEVAKSDITIDIKWSSIEKLLGRKIPYPEKVAFVKKFGYELKLLTILGHAVSGMAAISTTSTFTIGAAGAALKATAMAGNASATVGHLGVAMMKLNILTTVIEFTALFIYILYRTSFYIRFRDTSAEVEEEAKTLKDYIKTYFFQGRGVATIKLVIPTTIKLIRNIVTGFFNELKITFSNTVEGLKRQRFILASIMLIAMVSKVLRIGHETT